MLSEILSQYFVLIPARTIILCAQVNPLSYSFGTVEGNTSGYAYGCVVIRSEHEFLEV